jgi:CubicO group peptidase (beta-lactamase class C family)
MTAGWEWNEDLSYRDPLNSETEMDAASDRYRIIQERPIVARSGKQFTYNGGCTAVLAAMIERWTKTPLDKYAEQTLFRPLGISQYEWLKDANGTPIAASGLRLRPRDLAKFASLYLNKGRWHSTQVIPEAWIDASLTPHATVEGNLQYGYQWWLLSGNSQGNDKTIAWGAAFGNGGQRAWVVPSANLLAVVTAGLYNAPTGSTALRQMFAKYILPAVVR